MPKKGGKISKFELADGGTLLLDEIGEMPLPLQSKLLRTSGKGSRTHRRCHPIKVDVRLICSTNQNLTQLIQDGRFRADLYYRINTIELAILPSVTVSMTFPTSVIFLFRSSIVKTAAIHKASNRKCWL